MQHNTMGGVEGLEGVAKCLADQHRLAVVPCPVYDGIEDFEIVARLCNFQSHAFLFADKSYFGQDGAEIIDLFGGNIRSVVMDFVFEVAKRYNVILRG